MVRTLVFLIVVVVLFVCVFEGGMMEIYWSVLSRGIT